MCAIRHRGEFVDGALAFGQHPSAVYAWWVLTASALGVALGRGIARFGGPAVVVSAVVVGVLCVPLSALTVATNLHGAVIWVEVACSAMLAPTLILGMLSVPQNRRRTSVAA